MTPSPSPIDPPPAATAEAAIPPHPSDILMTLIVGFLAPMFLSASAGDPGFARLAAIETVNAYRLRNQADLLAVAQIIGFGLAALGSLSLSMADDIAPSMALRLRGNANALNRSAEQSRRALRDINAPTPHHTGPVEPRTADHPAPDNPDPAAPRYPEPRFQQSAQPIDPTDRPAALPDPAEQRHQAMWAIAMVKEAGEISAAIPALPLAERRTASIRAAALSSTANALLAEQNPSPPMRSPPVESGFAHA